MYENDPKKDCKKLLNQAPRVFTTGLMGPRARRPQKALPSLLHLPNRPFWTRLNTAKASSFGLARCILQQRALGAPRLPGKLLGRLAWLHLICLVLRDFRRIGRAGNYLNINIIEPAEREHSGRALREKPARPNRAKNSEES